VNLLPLPPGQHLIEASAGTGKTYTLMQLILRLLLGQGTQQAHAFELSEILVVTFTQAATHELKQRVTELLRAARIGFEHASSTDESIQACIDASTDVKRDLIRLKQAALSLDEAPIFTIHGFCSQILRDHSIELGLPLNVQIETDQSIDLLRLAEDLFRQHVTTLSPLEQEIAQTLWASPMMLLSRLQPLISRQTLKVIPEPHILHLPIEIESRMRSVKQQWLDEDLESLIGSSDLMRNRKSFTRRLEMSRFCRTAHLEPWSELWQLWRTSALAEVTKKNGKTPLHPIFDEFEDLSAQFEQFHAFQAGHLSALWSAFKHQRERLVLESGRLGVDELIPRVSEALNGSKRLAGLLAKQYPILLIDEFQDTDDLQYQLFRTIHAQQASHHLVLIGDPKQAIYRFRGADIKTYLRAAGDSLPAHHLDTNWRSSARLIDAVNHLFKPDQAFSKEKTITFFPSKASPRASSDRIRVDHKPAAPCWFVVSQETETNQAIAQVAQAQYIAQSLNAVLSGPNEVQLQVSQDPVQYERLRPEQLSILVRNRREAQLIQTALSSYGLASVYLAQTSIFETQTASDLAIILTAMLRPKNPGAVISALSTRLFQKSFQWLGQFRQSEHEQMRALETFTRWGKTWERSGVGAAIHQLVRDEGLGGTWINRAEGSRELTDLRHLAECLDTRQRHLSSRQQLIDWLIGGYRLDETLGQEDLRQRLDSDDQLINIMTIHAAKGLEFDAVCVPFADFGAVKTRTSGRELTEAATSSAAHAEINLTRSDKADETLTERAQEEEMRLFYVAATRAKSLLILGLGETRLTDSVSARTAPLARLLGIDESGGAEDAIRALPSSLFHLYTPEPITPSGLPPKTDSHWVDQRPIPTVDFQPVTFSYTGLTRQLNRSAAMYAPGLNDEPDGNERITLEYASTAIEQFLEAGLPKGANLGIKIHDLFQHLDFTQPVSEQSDLLEPFKTACRISAPEPSALLETWLESILSTPILDDGFCLKQLSMAKRLNEVEFHFPLTQLDALKELPFLSADRLSSPARAPWAQYMTGSIDLVFEHQQRFYIVDYKSNHLGPKATHYTSAKLAHVMHEHEYDLQYTIYAIALEKYLRLRSPDVAFNDQFGGVIYLFLRGMTGESGSGVFFTRPDGHQISRIAMRMSHAD